MEYDANDNLTKQYDAKGQTIEFAHDVLDRILSKTVTWTDDTSATQTDVITYTYDEANPDLIGGSNIGQLTTLSGAHNTIRYGYDNAGNTVAEEHSVPLNGTTYEYNFTRDMHPSGALISQTLPTSSSGGTFTIPDFEYDAAGRPTKFGSWLTGTTYDFRSNPTLKTFGNGMTEERMYDAQQGWIDEIRVLSTTGGTRELAKYWRSQAGRIERHRTWLVQDQYNYCYDYAGRLTVAADLISANKTCDTIGTWEGTELRDQFFSYRRDGSMASNSHVGDYIYSGSPVAHAPASVEGQALTYDANGNMTLGLNGKTMTYDGENRPLSVTLGANTSGYVYGADGTRLMKLEQIGTQPQSTTLYVRGVEIRDPGVNEVVLAYPHENVRLKFANANSAPEVSYLFRDHLNSVRMIADENQAIEERSTYKPFGEENESVLAASKAQETIGWIGERHDAGAGLQYLNARYYDPELGLFIQPDWWEMRMAGVGTNRYSYSFNDPVNLNDPGGNQTIAALTQSQEERDATNQKNADTHDQLADQMVSDGALEDDPVVQEHRSKAEGFRSRIGVTGKQIAVEEAVGIVAGAAAGRIVSGLLGPLAAKTIPKDPAALATQAAQKAQTLTTKRGNVTAIVTQDGTVLSGVSKQAAKKAAPGQRVDPSVAEMADDIASRLGGPKPGCYGGGCSEIAAISNGVEKGVNLNGAKAATANLGNRNGLSSGQIVSPCESCQGVLGNYGIRW